MGITRREQAVSHWLDHDGAFLFGKHRNELAEQVAVDDPSYVQWALDTVDDLADDDREVLEACMRFRNRK